MSDPLGYNPIGESAPGLPRHDAGLPGHVSSSYTPSAGEDYSYSAPASTRSYSGYSSGGGGMGGVGAGAGAGGPPSIIARAFGFFIAWITLPMWMVLYPLAGGTAVGLGGVAYFIFRTRGMFPEFSTLMSSLSLIMLVVVLPLSRLDIWLSEKVPPYWYLRHALRLAVAGGVGYYATADDPGGALATAAVMAAIFHFMLRGNLMRGLWHGLQTLVWVRKSIS